MRLDHITVLDLTRLLPGPYGTQLLRDMGADVVKVEDPDVGDYTRRGKTASTAEPTVFNMVNRGKRSVTLDLKTDAGRDAFMTMVAGADVVFEQFRPGVVDRLGVDYESVREHNGQIVYCSLSGYGQTGPFRNRVGHDLNYVGLSGLLDLTRANADEAPRIPGYPIADMAGGVFAVFSILGALLSRERTGHGEYIDVSMTDSVLSFSQVPLAETLSGEQPRPGLTRHTGRNPWYNVYETADGRYLTLAANEPKFWRVFCETVGREDLIELHTTREPIPDEAERQALEATLQELFRNRTREEWMECLGDDSMVGPVLSLDESIAHPQITSRSLLQRPDDAPPRFGFPAISSEGFPRPDCGVPDRGEQTEDVLREFGLSDAEIELLDDQGVL
jgi:crotonobetainyl-CoA:carnitine CoA-transferase CaiB-like acyl-CoA transferase